MKFASLVFSSGKVLLLHQHDSRSSGVLPCLRGFPWIINEMPPLRTRDRTGRLLLDADFIYSVDFILGVATHGRYRL